jgi:hypothetical protein
VSGGGNGENGKEIGEGNSRTKIERRRKQENRKEIGERHVDGNVGNNGDSRRKNGHGFSCPFLFLRLYCLAFHHKKKRRDLVYYGSSQYFLGEESSQH